MGGFIGLLSAALSMRPIVLLPCLFYKLSKYGVNGTFYYLLFPFDCSNDSSLGDIIQFNLSFV